MTTKRKNSHTPPAAPATQITPEETAEEKAQETAHAERATRNRIIRAMDALDASDLKHIEALISAIQNYSGCDAPPEEFILALVRAYSADLLTPDHAEFELADFRDSFARCVRTVRRFSEQYPDAVNAA